MTLHSLETELYAILHMLLGWLLSVNFYVQIGAIIVAVAVAQIVAAQIRQRIPLFHTEPADGAILRLRRFVHRSRDLLFPILTVLALAIAAQLVEASLSEPAWLVRVFQGIAVIGVLYALIHRFIRNPIFRSAAVWIGIPIATLYVFGVLGDVTRYLDSVSLEVGNIRLSVYTLLKAVIAASILFWLGRLSNEAGQRVIRQQETLDIPTRELLAKGFQLAVFFLIFILLLQVLGLDLTALAIFGGAVGVGLGFGLQQIASNFISGIILLVDRSMKVGDTVDLGNGRAGVVKAINMRSSTILTGDGKDILVPNEKFITDAFVNWTKSDNFHRFEIPFTVAYETDMHKVPDVVEDAVKGHEKVLDGARPPKCDMKGFGERGMNFAVGYWIAGTANPASEIHFLVWDALRDAGIAMPPPKP